MSSFKVGEIAILVQDPRTTLEKNMKYDGEDVVVVGPLSIYEVPPDRKDQRKVIRGYVVQLLDGQTLVAEPHELKKKPPEPDTKTPEPQAKDRGDLDKVMRWEDGPWRPNPIVVEELERQIAERKKAEKAAA